MRLTHAALPGMLERRRGWVLNVSSVAGFQPAPGLAVYAATKAFLVKFSQSLHLEAAAHGVHVTALCPGFTYSEFHDVNGTREQITNSTPPWLWLGADEVAAAGYEAVEANRPICVPGAPSKTIAAIAKLRGGIQALNKEGRARLSEAFEKVNGYFQELFTSLFGGGTAELQFVESDDPLEAGLEIIARPPGKKPTTMTLLSGGEQALTAIALIFAVFLTNPSPICVLDEVDAPLDDANIERFCDLLDAMAQETDTRYLIVTHNAVTMSRMHRLYGVTMAEQGVSQLVSVDLARAELLLAAQ